MSIGQACKYCTHGKMRPIHFSWDQAVILCDNKKCKSVLCASPWDCIIKKELPCAQESFSAFDPPNLLSDGSGGSSSGIYSEARSSLPSPAQSRRSATDEEVELLLKASYSLQNLKNHFDIPSESSELVSHSQIPAEKHSDHSYYSKYDGFFELLGDLDLELPTQSPNTQPHTESPSVETGLDFVTAKLEGWMRDFEFPSDSTKISGIVSDTCQQAPSEVQRAFSSDGCSQLPDETVSAESHTKKLHGPCIPSHRSAFSLVDVSHEESASLTNDEQSSSLGSLNCRSLSTERKESSELIQKCEDLCFSAPFVDEFVKEKTSTYPMRFMSPTASAASEDSGYNEEDGKSSSNFESVIGEGNQKLSLKTLIKSSLKNDDATKCLSFKQTQQVNFEKLIHNSLDWPEMSDVHTLTVLPAMVTTENNLTNRSQESLSVSCSTHTASSGEVCVTERDERERIDLSVEQLEEGLQIPVKSCEDQEHVSVFSENHNDTLTDENHSVSISDDHENVLMEDCDHGDRISEDCEHGAFSKTDNSILADESLTVGVSESFADSLISQSTDCLVSEGSSHSTFSEPKSVSEDTANSANSVDTFSETPCNFEEDKNKGEKQEKSKNRKIRNLSYLRTRKSVPSDNDYSVPNSSESRIGNKIFGIERDVKRRKCKTSGYNYKGGGKQNMSLKKGHLRKSRNREQPRRSAVACRVTPKLSKNQISSLRNQPSTSSGETLSAKKDAEELHKSDSKRNSPSRNPAWQIPQGRTNRLCRRMTNLSPRKLLVGQMNRDPWSVTDLYLEEVAIEIIVQDKQDVSHHGAPAAKCDVQLQNLLSLFGKKQSESEMSHLSTSETALPLPSNMNSELLEKDNRELPLKGRSKVSYESGEEKIDNCENLSIKHEQIAQNFSVAKDSRQKESVDLHKIELKDIATNILCKQTIGQNSSQCDIIDKSHPTNMTVEDSRPLQKIDSNAENVTVKKTWYSEANEETSLTVEVDSNSFLSEEVGLLKQQLISNTYKSMHVLSAEDDNKQVIAHNQETSFSVRQLDSSMPESVCTSSLEEDNNKQIVFVDGQETSVIVKQSAKTSSETNHDSLTTENTELNMETCVSERTLSLPSSIDEKSMFELTDSHYVDGCTSGLNIHRTSEFRSPWFEKMCEKEKTLIEKQNSCTPKIISYDQFANMDTCHSEIGPTIFPEVSSHYFFNNQKFGPVRSWIGDSDDFSLTGNEAGFKERMVGNSILSESFLDLKSEFSSSKYFQSLLEDMEADESFLQCPVSEHPSETLFEHFKSPLFFGETASNYAIHTEVPEVVEPNFMYREWSESSCTSKSFFQIYDQKLPGSVTSTAYTQVSHVPLPSSMAVVPITSVPSSISSPEVSSVIGKQDIGKKTVSLNNQEVIHILNSPNVNVPFDGPEPSSSISRLPSENLLPDTSVAGSSGDVIVKNKKPELTSESIKHISEWETDTCEKLINQKQDFAFDCAATSCSGDGTDQETCSDTEQVNCNRNSKRSGALADCSPQDILSKESRLDLLKTETKSLSSLPISKEISLSLSKPLSLVQTSTCFCSAGVKKCRTCCCNKGNMENKVKSTMACREQIECQTDSLSNLVSSDLDVSSDSMPVISFDPNDEIQITMPPNIPERSGSPQEGSESCALKNNYTSEKYLVDVPVNQCSIDEDISAFNFDEIKKQELIFTRKFNLGLKRKTDDEYEGQKKLKLLNTTTEVKINEYIPQNASQSSASSNSQHSLYMCGILDNSVPHDEYCCSSLHQDFEDLPDHTADKEITEHAGKTYAGSRKLCKSNDKSNDAAVYDIVKSFIAKDSTDKDYSICSNVKETTTHKINDQTVFDDDAKFGSVKASPQYDSQSCLRVETEDSLCFFQLDSFNNDFLGSLLSPTESNSSLPKSSQEEEDSEHFDLLKSNASLEPEKPEDTVMEKIQQNKMSNEEILHSAPRYTLLMDNGDNLEDKGNIAPSCIPSTDDASRNVDQLSASCEEAKDSFVHYKESSFSDANELNQGLSRTSVLKDSQPSRKTIVLESLQPSGKTVVLKSLQPFGKTLILKSSQAVGKTILLKSPQSSSKTQPSNKIIALNSSQPAVSSHNSDIAHNKTQFSPLPSVSSHVLNNMNMVPGALYLGNQNVAGATASQSLLLLPPHTKENKALQPLPVTSSFAHCGTTNNQIISSDVQKQVSQIDYQASLSAGPPVTVPPALATNNRDSSYTIAQGSNIHYPVGRIVRMMASSPISHDCIQVKKSELEKQKEKNVEAYPNHSNNEENPSMLKMVKYGSRGQFYLRPSSALKNAISEMRKKNNIEDKEEKETSSGYLTLPDGNPIPHPIFIPSKRVEEVQVIKQKRKKRRKRCINGIKTLLTEKIKESFEFNDKNEIPKVMVVYAKGNFHICQIDVVEDR